MNKKRVLIIADLQHYESKGVLYAYESYVQEIEGWCINYDIQLVTQITPLPAKGVLIPLQKMPENISVINNPLRSGPGFVNNMIRLFQVPIILVRLGKLLLSAELIHTRGPGVSSAIVNLLNKSINKPCIVKWATVFQREYSGSKIIPIEYDILRRPASRTRVLIYGEGLHERHISYFPALAPIPVEPTVRKTKLSDEINIVFVGRLHRHKEPQRAVEALGLYSESIGNSKIKLHIIGDGELRNEIRSQLAKFPKLKFEFHGPCSWIASMNILKNMDCLIVANKFEGWGKVVNEAFHFGVIPLVCDAGNARIPASYGGLTGGIIYKYDLSDFNEKFDQLRKLSATELDRLRKNGRDINTLLNIKNYHEGIMNIYEQIRH